MFTVRPRSRSGKSPPSISRYRALPAILTHEVTFRWIEACGSARKKFRAKPEGLAKRVTWPPDVRTRRWSGSVGDYEQFLARQSVERAQVFCKRFRDELGYRYSEAVRIYRQGHGSRTKYYMIDASDHPDACALMSRAYGLAHSEVNAVDVPLPWTRSTP